MKSSYQNKKFAEYWEKRVGKSGEVYKRMVLDPIMFDTVGIFSDKKILELGCGNGYLAPKLIEQDPKSIILMDISRYNLEFAKEKCTDSRITFLEQDATKKWQVNNNSIDVIYSNMMLNEVENIKTPIEEVFRVLRKGGVLIFSVIHPSCALFIFAQGKAGVESNNIEGLGNYFRRGVVKYTMGFDSKNNFSFFSF